MTPRVVRSVVKALVEFVRVLRRQRARLLNGGRISTGRSFVIGPRAQIHRRARVRVGDRVGIGSDFVCQVHAEIGDDVMISSYVAFIGDDHRFDNPLHTITTQGNRPVARVVLMGDNLVGHGTIVIGDVVIGRGAIVGAGSLVSRDLPPDTVCVGRPARPIRARHRAGLEPGSGR